MKAIVYHRYGPPDVLELQDIAKPVPADDEVLVRVRASSVNPVDWHTLTGVPYVLRLMEGLRRPKSERLGVDFAGTVEAVGKGVTRFRSGDDVFGGRNGAFAEYVTVREVRGVVPKPSNITFEEAAAVPVAGLTALEGLRQKGQLKAGQHVLINGASGGVGTFAVQIAKSLGAVVTGVCSTRNVDLVKSLGADQVIDYTREDFTRLGQRYDLLLDVAGGRSWSEYKRILNPVARLVMVGGPKRNRWIGPIGGGVRILLASRRASQKVIGFITKMSQENLIALKELLEAGKMRPVIDRRYTLSEVSAALSYLGEGHAKGKIVVSL